MNEYVFQLYYQLPESEPDPEAWLDALFEAGWPGERCVPGSDVNRVHVTLSRLRSAGLDGLLESDAGRFRLKPDTKVVLEEAA